jgi:hypothetical protein
LLPLVSIAPTAACSYWALWQLEPSDTALGVVMYTIIGAQALAGGIVAVRAVWRAYVREQGIEAIDE